MIQPGPEIIAQEKDCKTLLSGRPYDDRSGGIKFFSRSWFCIREIKGKNKNIKRKSLIKISEEGATFRNYLNGDKVYLTPERSIELQRHFGADLIFVLDECTPFNVTKKYTENSMYLSHRWAKDAQLLLNLLCRLHSQMGHLEAILYGMFKEVMKI